MLEARDEFSTPEHRRYSAECRRLAAVARPPERRPTQKPMAEWLGTIVTQFRKNDFRKGRRARKLFTTLAHR